MRNIVEVAPPFTVDEFITASYGLQLEANERQVRTEARISSLGSCARETGYMMAGVEPTDPQQDDPERRHSKLTTEQGTYVEDLTCDVIDQMGHHVSNRQLCIGHPVCKDHEQGPLDYPMTGHPDGELGLLAGEQWGFEHKHLGRYTYLETFKKGFHLAHPGYLAQIILYGHALGWEKVLCVVLAQDASSTEFERRQAARYAVSGKAKETRDRNAWALRKDWNPKVLFYAYDLRPAYAFVPALQDRADEIANYVSALGPDAIKRDFSGVTKRDDGHPAFPCGYCDFATRCNEVGSTGMAVRPLPFYRATVS